MSTTRRYRSAWEAEPQFSGWLTHAEGDATKAFCKLCKCFLQAHKRDITNHGKCKKHLQTHKFSQLGTSNSKVNSFFVLNIPIERKIAELKVAAFIAEHCSVLAVDHLGSLVSTLDKSSELLCGLKIHRTKCAGLIKNVISPCMLEELIEDIGDSNYSMIIDESTSIDTRKTMCIMVRYFSKKKLKVETTFYRLLEIDGGDAETLTQAFKSQLVKDGLDIKKMIGIGVDGANVMVGQHHSFSSILKTSVPHLTVIKCVCHSLHLAAEEACKVLPSQLEFIVRDCHSWFSSSTKRQIDYSVLYETLTDKKPLKIDKLSGTRWLARINAIVKILEQWDALELHFRVAKDTEKCYTATQLHKLFAARENKLYLLFLKVSLKAITDCNRLFQSDNVEPLKLLTDIQTLLLNYLSILIPPGRLSMIRRNDLHMFRFRDVVMNISCINLGHSFNEESQSQGMNDNELKVIKENCTAFLIVICEQIQKRIPNNVNVLEKISSFTPEKASSQVRPDINDIIVLYSDVIGTENIDTAMQEWRVLPFHQWKQTDTTEAFWGEVSLAKNAAGEPAFKIISRLAMSILSLPFSNASVERAFSVMNIVKNRLRNKMMTTTADHIMLVRFSLKIKGCTQFQPTGKMLRKFSSEVVYQNNTDDEDDVMDVLNLFE